MSGSAASLAPTATLQLSAVAQQATGATIAGKTFAWSSLNTGVATVSPTGLVTAISIGTTTIRAVSDGIQGDYVISVAYPVCAPSRISGSISAGQTRSGTFDHTGCQRLGIGPLVGWSITVATESSIMFELSAVAGESFFEITNAAMDGFAMSSLGGPGVPARAAVLLLPGTYYVWAGAANGAPYTLQATAVTLCGGAGSVTGAIENDEAVAGALTTSSCLLPHLVEGQGWSFTLAENSPVRFDVVAVGFEPWLVVTDATLNIVAVGPPVSATEATISSLLPAGDLQIWVTTIAGGLGTFSLTRSTASIASCETAPPVGAVAIGGAVNGILESTDCALPDGYTADPWSLTVAAGATLQVDLQSAAFDTYLFLLDSEGNVLAEDDDGGEATNSRLLGIFAAGQYTLLVSSWAPGQSGAYSLSVQQLPGVVAGAVAPESHSSTGRRKMRPRPAWPVSLSRP